MDSDEAIRMFTREREPQQGNAAETRSVQEPISGWQPFTECYSDVPGLPIGPSNSAELAPGSRREFGENERQQVLSP